MPRIPNAAGSALAIDEDVLPFEIRWVISNEGQLRCGLRDKLLERRAGRPSSA